MQDNSVWVPMRDHPSEDVDALIPPSQMPNKWDFVLVCDDHKPLSTKKSKEEEFLEELRKKKLIVETIKDKKLFHGIRAQSSIIQKYKCLLSDPDYELDYLNTQPEDEQQGMTCTRIRIVNFILQNTDISSKQNFQDLMKENVFETAFPLHEKEKLDTFLKINWRSIHNTHLIEELRMYSGEKVALYFAWLSWYTYVLLIAAVPGIILVIYGFMSFNSSQVSQEICAANTTIMCPLCDQKCPFWPLSDTCTYAKLTHLFDNEGTVLFAIFMAVWATVYLELWKRQRAKVVSEWNLYWWDEEKDDLAMELISNPKGREIRMYQHSYVRTTIVLILFTLMICVLIGIAHAIVLYRVVVTVLFAQSNSGFFRERATTMAVVTGAVLHYLSIIIMSKVNRHVAVFLCDLEKPRTFSERENNFTVKIFILQFFTHFSSLIYVAFFLGRINGHPGNYVRVAGKWRLEECHPSGCLLDLFIQMAIIMTLKQTLSHLQEYLLPWIKCQCRKLCAKPKSHSRVHMEESAQNQCKDEWLQNYQLNEVDIFSLFNEFLEMMIQYSFTTIFVAAFPLAPLLAFFNNLIEIRYDAVKMAKLQRRMVPRKAKDIGIWLQVLEAIGILAVIANGLVISITSDFIPMQVYKYTRGPCMQKNYTGIE